MPPERNFKEAQEILQEGEVSLTSLCTRWDAELEYLEARLEANTDERDGIAEKMSEFYLSDRFAEIDYIRKAGCGLFAT